mgnify:CR=1 FL=1
MEDPLNQLLELEHAGWRSLCDGTGADFYGSLMTSECRMVLANGAVLTRDDVIASLEHARTWSSYTIDEPVAVTASEDVVAVIYTGTGHRDGNDDFTGVMTSVYLRTGTGWRLAHYQQTPKA